MCANVRKQDKQILTSDRRACYIYKVVIPTSFCLVHHFVLFACFLSFFFFKDNLGMVPLNTHEAETGGS